MSTKAIQLTLKIVESVGLVLGATIFTLHFFSFYPSKGSFAYSNASEWGMAIGVLFLATAFVAGKWK